MITRREILRRLALGGLVSPLLLRRARAAYQLTRASSQYFTVSLPPPSVGAISLAFRFKLNSLPGATGASRFSLAARCNTSVHGYYAVMTSTTVVIGFYNGAYRDFAFAWPPETTNWHSLVLVWDFSTTTAALKAYIDGALLGSATVARNTVADHDAGFIGWVNNSGSTLALDGTIAEAECWNASLDANDAKALYVGASAALVRPQTLLRYWQLVRPLQDVKSGTAISAVNAPTVAAHPRIYR